MALTTAHYYTPSGRVIQRPWDASFDEYMTYRERDQNAPRPHPASELKYTDAGRKVYGGGGIEPDHFIPGSVEGFNPTRFSRSLRGAFVSFSRRFTAQGDSRPASQRTGASHTVAPSWAVSDDILAEFRQMLVDQGVKIDEDAYRADQTFIKAEIKYEVDTELFGAEEARRNLAKVDPQLQDAVGLFDEAKKLLEARTTH